MNDEVKTAKEQVQEEEQDWIVHTVNQNYIPIFLMAKETALFLSKLQSIAATYMALWFLEQEGLLMGWKRSDIATYMGISRPTLQNHLEQLEKIGLISVVTNHKFGDARKNIIFNTVKSLPTEQLVRLHKVSGIKAQQKVLEELRQQITTTAIIEKKEQEQTEQTKLFIEQTIKQGVEQGVKKVLAKKEGRDQKFPVGDYTSVLDGYRKYKGIYIKPHSPDEARYRKAAKNMFLSGWKVLDILECMKFFNAYCKSEGYEWMTAWTLETIGKKMGDFKAGNLKRPELGDDLQEYTG